MLRQITRLMARRKVTYTHTVESLAAIVMGLQPQRGDRVHAVGGSGDQAFALLAEGAEVTVTDLEATQMEYIERRIICLLKGDERGFLAKSNPPFFTRYPPGWSRKEVKRRAKERYSYLRPLIPDIRKGIPRLTLQEPGNILETMGEESHLYLTNILTYARTRISLADQLGRLEEASSGTLIYIADYNRIVERLGENGVAALSKGVLRLEEERTRAARQYEKGYWQPAVFERR